MGDSMTDEEIKAYVDRVESVSLSEVENILPDYDYYNADVIIGKICEGLSENVNILRRLNDESGNHELDNEIRELLRKIFVCNNYLDKQSKYRSEMIEPEHKLVFAKTPAGKPYFSYDLGKVSREAYDEVKKTLEEILYGVNMADNSKVKYYTNIDLPQKVLEFKGYQVRIFTTKLKGNILCVFGLSIKKANNDKRIKENLKLRISSINKQIEELKVMMNDPTKRQDLLVDGKEILDDIMHTLNGDDLDNSDEVELLFPSDEELEKLVPYNDESDNMDAIDNQVSEEVHDLSLDEKPVEEVSLEQSDSTNSKEIPSSSKKIKRRTRGLGKKTIARNTITESLKGLSLDELLEIQNFIDELRKNKELNDNIANIYENFLNMSDEQIRSFEDNIKYFKHDKVGRHK